ncbi:MAG TPA: thiamine pyrophosphate-binding protein [Spirochaetia bacterium]|nr:thiamine pyrophosphate-binding protein [Spirochaetales bacterium]HRW24445.1 thiamine pyrophosphate-binding protein [Spirochaetia bacterium]
MALVNGGKLIEGVFSMEGVKYVFGIPGGHIYPMIEACEEAGIKFIGVRNEMNAAFMAEGWAFATGKPGVCTGTAGPGATNMLTGVANAYCNQAPMIAVGGKARVCEYESNQLQDFDTMGVFKGASKKTYQIPDGNRIPEYFGRAFAEARRNTPGPVYMEVPRDKMEACAYDDEAVRVQDTWQCETRPAASEADVAKAAAMIDAAKRPMALVGSGAFWSGAAAEVTALIEKAGIPVFTRNAARGLVPDYHPLAMCIGSDKHPVCAAALQNADLIIVIGTRTGYTLSREAFPAGANILRVDINGAAITDQLDVRLGIVGDAKAVAAQLTAAVKPADHKEWVAMLVESRDSMAQFLGQAFVSPQTPIHPLRLVAEIRKRVDKDTVVVIDGGDTASWGNLLLPAMGPGQLLTIATGSFGPLGVGVPYAMAAKLAHPGKKVILLTGDGAFGYGAMEYDTMMRYGIKVTTVILNDSCWGMIKNSEAKRAGEDKEFVGLYLRDTHYEKVAEAVGAYGEYVDKPEDIGPAIDRALAQDKPSIVNVMTDVKIGFAF